MKIKNIDDLSGNAHLLPINVLVDINHRITDWIASGGNIEDDYIIQQCKYAENIINRMESES